MVETANNQGAELLANPSRLPSTTSRSHVEEPIVTGLEIKQAAVDQGVRIDLTFRLVRG